MDSSVSLVVKSFSLFLEERKIRRVGDLREIPVDCRIVSATNSNLKAEIEAGRFREDLYYRVNVIAINMPTARTELFESTF